LFRNFKSNIILEEKIQNPIYLKESILINSVTCNSGTPYAKVGTACYFFPEKTKQQSCLYTKPNEYGCTFGNIYGFKKSTNYWIQSSYALKPDTLFRINKKYYIKFVAYSKKMHKLLVTDSNLILRRDVVAKDYYLPKEDVIIYVPFTPDNPAQYKIINKNNFEFDKSNLFLIIIIFISPTFVFLVLWFLFGRENIKTNFPKQMSFYPKERKGWTVAAYFNPPFSKLDKNFFAAMMLDFYRKKVIDTKMIGKQVYIKIINFQAILDPVEKKFMDMLKYVQESCPEKYKHGDFFNLKKASKSIFTQMALKKNARELQKEIKKQGKKYIDAKIMIPLIIIFFMIYFLSFLIIKSATVIFLFVSFFLMLMIGNNSSILIKFKEKYYSEYEHWQSFRNYIKVSPTLTSIEHKGVILWEQHLVYASALGVAKKVLKELKKRHMITESQYHLYIGTHNMSTSFATSSGSSGHGGGGVGGGGVGGGGGGGR